jgi:hypothetical protein
MIPYRGCSIKRSTWIERFFNKSLRGGAGWSNHRRICWEAFDENGKWLWAMSQDRMRDCKRAIDKHIKKEESNDE